MLFKNMIFISSLAAILSACAATPPDEPYAYQKYLESKDLRMPAAESFDHCRGYGCAYRDNVALSDTEWGKIAHPFRKATTAEAEREAISQAIAELEQIVGEKTGTSGDIAGTFGKVGTHQLDCVDESTNTTIYLAVMDKKGLIKHHSISGPTTRTPFTGMAQGRFWPHQTAVIFDNKTNAAYAVDSWFRDNGAPADVVPLHDWLYGWGPQEDKVASAPEQTSK
ncbi:MAG: hypothetical protein HYU57_00805 [Micavibrio aeruginosavorus]|nr:hypothetical protein [Micavibrio aeruginosavorus]